MNEIAKEIQRLSVEGKKFTYTFVKNGVIIFFEDYSTYLHKRLFPDKSAVHHACYGLVVRYMSEKNKGILVDQEGNSVLLMGGNNV